MRPTPYSWETYEPAKHGHLPRLNKSREPLTREPTLGEPIIVAPRGIMVPLEE